MVSLPYKESQAKKKLEEEFHSWAIIILSLSIARNDRLISRLTKNQPGIEHNCTKQKMGNREMSFSVVLEPKPKVPSLARGECEACGRWVGDLMSKKGRIQWIQEWAKKRPVSVMPEPEAPLPLQPLLLLWTASPSSCSTAILNTNAQSLSSCAVPQLVIGIKRACKQRLCWPSRHLFKRFTCHPGFI